MMEGGDFATVTLNSEEFKCVVDIKLENIRKFSRKANRPSGLKNSVPDALPIFESGSS